MKNGPFSHKMRQGNGIRPHRKLVDSGICNAEGRVQTYDRGQECPRSEDTGGQGIGRGCIVDLGGVSG